MNPYDENQVLEFLSDVEATFSEAHAPLNLQSLVWPTRMQFDAVTMGYPAARAKHLRELRVALKLPVTESPFHVGPGPLTADRAKSVVLATSAEFPQLTQVFGSNQEAIDAATELLGRTIWHLQHAGFQAGKQQNPSTQKSGDKVTIFIDGSWHIYDIFSLGFAGRATTVQFIELTGASHIDDPGIPD
jgi:hypothetical protein